MEIQMLLPIFDKWDVPNSRFAVLVGKLTRHEGNIVWCLEETNIGRFEQSFRQSIQYLEDELPQFKTLLVIKRVYVRLDDRVQDWETVPYFDDDLANTMTLEEFKAYLNEGLFQLS